MTNICLPGGNPFIPRDATVALLLLAHRTSTRAAQRAQHSTQGQHAHAPHGTGSGPHAQHSTSTAHEGSTARTAQHKHSTRAAHACTCARASWNWQSSRYTTPPALSAPTSMPPVPYGMSRRPVCTRAGAGAAARQVGLRTGGCARWGGGAGWQAGLCAPQAGGRARGRMLRGAAWRCVGCLQLAPGLWCVTVPGASYRARAEGRARVRTCL